MARMERTDLTLSRRRLLAAAGAVAGLRYGCDWFRPKGQNTAGFCDTHVSERLSQDAPSIWLFVSKSIQAADKRLHAPFISRNGALLVDQHTWLEA